VQSDNIDLMSEVINEEKSKGRGFLIVDQNLTFLEAFNDIIHLIDHGEQIYKTEGVNFRKEIESRIVI
jgi:ABC-type multidrug transport system ATPase subunit